MKTVKMKYSVIVDPGDQPEFVTIQIIRNDEVEVDETSSLTALYFCAKLQEHGVLDAPNQTYYPPHRIMSIRYEVLT